ncbi:hypothetical protein L7F22_038535 [Adiantum nelumboides]|nr:hypothetical protein [Adiantum nelumboides]
MATSAFRSTTRRNCQIGGYSTSAEGGGVPSTPRSRRDPSPSGKGFHRRSASVSDFSARYLSDCSSTSEFRSFYNKGSRTSQRSDCPSDSEEMVMKQGEDIKNLALKNEELEHTIQIQNLKMQHQDEKIQALQDAFNKQVSNVQDALATHDEKLAHISDNATGNTTSWAHVVKSTPNAIPQTHETYANVDDKEYNEREKLSMNIVI